MRLAIPLLAAALLAGCAQTPVTRAAHIMPRPAPYAPDPPPGAFGPVLPAAQTVPYPPNLPGL
jgi:hypothetical protein